LICAGKVFPAAPSTEKAWFARQEGWDFQPEPKDVLFADYIQQWYLKVWDLFSEGTKKDDWQGAINYWLLPYFSEMTFYQISGTEVKNFIATLKRKSGYKEGQPLSKRRIRNILVPFRAIFNDVCEEFRWNLPDPFRNIRKHLPDTEVKDREVFRFDEWKLLLQHMDSWYVPIAEFMILTGTISSEVAGLRRSDIFSDHILIQNTIVRNREKQKTKTKYRSMKIPIIEAIRKRLNVALDRTVGNYIFCNPSGGKFKPADFCNNIWNKALIKAGLSDKVPYCMRHSFAAWSLTIKVDMLRLVNLLGHKDKKMVFEVYGNYVEDLEQDAQKILDYVGQDFIKHEMKQHVADAMNHALIPHLLMQIQNQINLTAQA